MKGSKVVVVIPTHKKDLTHYEIISLIQCHAVLKNYDIRLLCPEGLDISKYQELVPEVQVEYFDPSYFSSLVAYNKFLLSNILYTRFKKWDYLLVHELDAFVFKDELKYWCDLKYDYIGAPWYDLKNNVYGTVKLVNYSRFTAVTMVRKLFNRNSKKVVYVGNGGLSLRKVQKFYYLTKWMPYLFPRLTKVYFNDDIVWSFFISAFVPYFNIPDHTIARNFSIEFPPENYFHHSGFELPFGSHAWFKFAFDEWKPYLRKLGYQV